MSRRIGPWTQRRRVFLTSGVNRRVSQDEMDNPDPETGTEIKGAKTTIVCDSTGVIKFKKSDIVPADCVGDKCI